MYQTYFCLDFWKQREKYNLVFSYEGQISLSGVYLLKQMIRISYLQVLKIEDLYNHLSSPKRKNNGLSTMHFCNPF